VGVLCPTFKRYKRPPFEEGREGRERDGRWRKRREREGRGGEVAPPHLWGESYAPAD